MCGLTGIVSVRHRSQAPIHPDMERLREMLHKVESKRFQALQKQGEDPETAYLGGKALLQEFEAAVWELKRDEPFFAIFNNKGLANEISQLGARLSRLIESEDTVLAEQVGHLPARQAEAVSQGFELLKDIRWFLTKEIGENLDKVRRLLHRSQASEYVVGVFKRINAVLNSIDRLEVRGRDSAGISLLFFMDPAEYDRFQETLDKANFLDEFQNRSNAQVLGNRSISLHPREEGTALAFTYKVAAEIGRLGDNIRFLREQIETDAILQAVVNFNHLNHTVLSHTRWASVGAITEPNCHPVDNLTTEAGGSGFFHVCLNGDIDNYTQLRSEFESQGGSIPQTISTDTKIIPLQVQKHYRQVQDVTEAFRLAVNDFKGSHAICMHTDLAPGKLFLAQRGSGQAIFVGLAKDHYMPASEVYGFVEETAQYLKLDGEKGVETEQGTTQGQIFVLNQESAGRLEGVQALHYNGLPIELTESDIKTTAITSRDIDRQDYPHYFLKEISESPVSVDKTLLNRWKVKTENGQKHYILTLDATVIPEKLETALRNREIRRIFFVGQGTAGVAAAGCAEIFNYYLNDPTLPISAVKASEMSGFRLQEGDGSMTDTLVVAISQSGTTTDTNRTVDMVRERGAYTLSIVNRRDSDLTFKTDGVLYTSSGRDIEMSVASTKAFYAQIVAGALLGLYIAELMGRRDSEYVAREVRDLLALPDHMRKVLGMREQIEASARGLAVSRTYWAAVGSGPNKIAADEIRIKLSELCYKTISSDYIEDKKHIDLSSEPLILVCAAGTRNTVLGDIVKDTAIFRAHKAVPVVIADEGEHRFDDHAADVFRVPVVNEHLAPILNTLVGHLWGYYAALAINDGSAFLFGFREEMQKTIEHYAQEGINIYELVVEESFREKAARFYNEFRKRRTEHSLPSTLGVNPASDLTLLLKYLTGRLQVSDFELDFNIKGTAPNMVNKLFECLGESINAMARPVDAIKHQAKTVTVGTSRISEGFEGVLFETLESYDFKISQLTTRNVLVLRNLQGVIATVHGATLYRIAGLNLLGEPTDQTIIQVVRRDGTSAAISSRVEQDRQLKGTKRIITREGNIYVGKGRKDDRSILCIPLLSADGERANQIEYLLLLHVGFKSQIPLSAKIRALGGKYERIINIVQENNVSWEDRYLETISTESLFGWSAEKVGEQIVSQTEHR